MTSSIGKDWHYGERETTFQLAGVTFTLKATGAMTGGAIAVVEWVLPAHHQGCRPHLHRQTNEALYVVQGALACTLNEKTRLLREATLLYVAPGVVHHIWNPAAMPVTYLTMFVPAGPEGLYTTLAAGPVTGTDGWPARREAIHSIGGRFDYFLLPKTD